MNSTLGGIRKLVAPLLEVGSVEKGQAVMGGGVSMGKLSRSRSSSAIIFKISWSDKCALAGQVILNISSSKASESMLSWGVWEDILKNLWR